MQYYCPLCIEKIEKQVELMKSSRTLSTKPVNQSTNTNQNDGPSIAPSPTIPPLITITTSTMDIDSTETQTDTSSMQAEGPKKS
jgi:hypothetical protein